MGMTFAKHERIWLRQSPDFSESWLHERDQRRPLSSRALESWMCLSVKGSSAAADELTCCLPTVKTTPASKWKSCWVRPTRATPALLRGSKTDPQRPLPTDPLTTDSVRRRPTTLSHLIEDVTCEDGLRLLPRPTARSKALPDDDPPWVLWTPKKARECAGRCSWAHGSDDGSPRRSSRRRCGSVCGTTAASGRWLGSWT